MEKRLFVISRTSYQSWLSGQHLAVALLLLKAPNGVPAKKELVVTKRLVSEVYGHLTPHIPLEAGGVPP